MIMNDNKSFNGSFRVALHAGMKDALLRMEYVAYGNWGPRWIPPEIVLAISYLVVPSRIPLENSSQPPMVTYFSTGSHMMASIGVATLLGSSESGEEMPVGGSLHSA